MDLGWFKTNGPDQLRTMWRILTENNAISKEYSERIQEIVDIGQIETSPLMLRTEHMHDLV